MEELILSRKIGQIGLITLNRPQALNAINLAMNSQIFAVLRAWEQDPDIQTIVINSSSERAFCSGGDIRQIYTLLQTEGFKHAQQVFQRNYQLIAYAASYPKTTICFMDGITMGGGLGLGAFTNYRIVTERSILAMPEVHIGLVPDAGMTSMFAQSVGFTGLRAMLTGYRFGPKEAICLGLANYIVPSSELDPLIRHLEKHSIEEVLSTYLDHSVFDQLFLKQVEAIYKDADIETIIDRLSNCSYDWAKEDLKLLLAASPYSLEASFIAWHKKQTKLREALQQEYNMVSYLIQRSDFSEGIRASIIDKDKTPQWVRGPISREEIETAFLSSCKLFPEC